MGDASEAYTYLSRCFFSTIAAAWLCIEIPGSLATDPSTYLVGVAKRDITPAYPIRLNGFGFRRAESEGVTQPIWAKALAIGSDAERPVVLVTLDSLGIRQSMVDEVARRLKARCGIERDRLVVTFSHSHTTPKVLGACDTIFSSPIPPEHQEHIKRYTAELTDAIEEVAVAALADRRPSTLSWAVGEVGFAKNRRPQGGPVDHTLPVLVVKSATDDSLRAIYTTYACHCVTLSNNKISGDWAGFAQRAIESNYPGVIALTSIGCGSDANPASGVTGDDIAAAADQGAQIAKEVDRIIAGPLKPIGGPISASLSSIDLPLNPPPTREQLEKLAANDDPAGYNAKFQLEKIERGERLLTSLDYPIQVWEFGDSLAMVFMAGEVCVDYSVRLKSELDADRLWLHGYANDFCAYIPSERLLKEGGYGGGAEVVYFALPNTLAPGLEDTIVAQVHKLVSASFAIEHTEDSADSWSVERSIKSIKTKPGLIVEVAASEPLVEDPVAIDFGPDGSLWVAEMPDYSQFAEEEFEQHGNVRHLTDADQDGRYDQVSVFARGLRFPTGVKAWRKGVLICDAPDVIYCEDTDGDGQADVRKVLLSGFATHNAQARVNSLRWGLDNWLYGACGIFGGTIRTLAGYKIELGQRDFRFLPDTGELKPVSGRTQQGRARDDWGNWFGCENESLLDHYPLVDRYMARNSRMAPPPPEVPVPQPSAVNLHPIGRLTLFKLSGPPGRPTSVCGLDFYRDELLGEQYSNNAFLAEPVNQLVHRMVLSPNGSSFTGSVATDEYETEFLASDDPWFRPVQIRTGPDGCLYVVDMHRAVIEHQKFIPKETLRQLNLTAGREQGRIYRIRPRDVDARPIVDLTQLDVDGLVRALDTPNGTQRDQVQELLVQRHETSAIPQLRKLATTASRATTRLQAMCTLDGLSGMSIDVLLAALADQDATVRRHAIRISEQWGQSAPAVMDSLLSHVDDLDPQVQLQLACTLGEFDDPRIASALARIALANSADPYILAGVWSSIDSRNAIGVLDALFPQNRDTSINASVIEPAMRLALELGAVDDLSAIGKRLIDTTHGEFKVWQFDMAAQMLRRTRQQTGTDDSLRTELAPLLAAAKHAILEDDTDDKTLASSIRVIAAVTPSNELLAIVEPFLGPQRSPELQVQLLDIVASLNDLDTADVLLGAWPQLSKPARDKAFEILVTRPQITAQLMDRIATSDLSITMLDAAQRQRLLNHSSQAIREQAERLFTGFSSSDRQSIVREYLANIDEGGNALEGKKTFARCCANCHLLEGVGHVVGPDLSALTSRTPQALVESILDPNRAIDDRFRSFTAVTADGLTYSGILTAETSNSVTLVDQEAKPHVILRSDLDSLILSGMSLMPEGLEREISPGEMKDLIAYLTQLHAAPNTSAGSLPTCVGERHRQHGDRLLSESGSIDRSHPKTPLARRAFPSGDFHRRVGPPTNGND